MDILRDLSVSSCFPVTSPGAVGFFGNSAENAKTGGTMGNEVSVSAAGPQNPNLY